MHLPSLLPLLMEVVYDILLLNLRGNIFTSHTCTTCSLKGHISCFFKSIKGYLDNGLHCINYTYDIFIVYWPDCNLGTTHIATDNVYSLRVGS